MANPTLQASMQYNLIGFYDTLMGHSDDLHEKSGSRTLKDHDRLGQSHGSNRSQSSCSHASANSTSSSVSSTLDDLHEDIRSIDEKLSMTWKQENENVRSYYLVSTNLGDARALLIVSTGYPGAVRVHCQYSGQGDSETSPRGHERLV